MFDISLAIFLLLSPIIFLPAIGNVTALQFYQFGVIDSTNSFLQLQFFQFGIVALFLISLFCKKQREFKDKWLSLFMVGCLITVFLHPLSVRYILNIFLGFILYKVVYEYAKNIKLILIPVIIVCILNVILSTIQSFGIRLIFHPPFGQSPSIVGFMRSPTHLGIYQALSIPVCFIFNPLLAIIPIISLFFAHSHTAFLGFWIGMIYIFKKRIGSVLSFFISGSLWFMLLISLSVLSVLILIRNWGLILGEFSTRLWIWGETLKSLTLFGSGFGRFKFFNPVMGEFDNPYNIYLGLIYIMGVLSIPIFIWIYETINKYNKFKMKDRVTNMIFTTCLMLLAMGLRSSFMDIPRLAGTTIIMFGLLNVKMEVRCER